MPARLALFSQFSLGNTLIKSVDSRNVGLSTNSQLQYSISMISQTVDSVVDSVAVVEEFDLNSQGTVNMDGLVEAKPTEIPLVADSTSSTNPLQQAEQQANARLTQSLEMLSKTLERLGEQLQQLTKKQKQLSVPFKIRKARADCECVICRQRIPKGKSIVKLNCRCKYSHHLRCIALWLKTNHSCPLCRRRFRINEASFLRYD